MRVVTLLLVLATATTASADRKTAERLFRAGEKAYKEQRFLVAAENFEQAYKELTAPELAFSAAQAYRRQYRVDPSHIEYAQLAVKYYRVYLDARKSGGRVGDAADSFGEMQRELDRLGVSGKVQAGALETKTQLGVSIAFADKQQTSSLMQMHEVDEGGAAPSTQVSAKAFVDGKPVELDELHDIGAGDHRVSAQADGYKPTEKQVHVFAGTVQNAELVLEPLPAEVLVKTEAGATLMVDGRGLGVVPRTSIPLSGGTHVLTVLRPGRRAEAREITVTRAQKVEVPIDLHATTRRRAVPVVAGVSGLCVVASGVFLVGAKYYQTLAVNRLHHLEMGDQGSDVLTRYDRFQHRRDLSIDLSYAAAGTAVAIGVTAAWLYYFDSPSAEGVRVEPYASPTGGGAAISGRF